MTQLFKNPRGGWGYMRSLIVTESKYTKNKEKFRD